MKKCRRARLFVLRCCVALAGVVTVDTLNAIVSWNPTKTEVPISVKIFSFVLSPCHVWEEAVGTNK